MSGKISGAVWDSGPTVKIQRFVLVCIADCANDEGVAWPMISTIAKRCLTSERYIYQAVNELVNGGWMIVTDHPTYHKRNAYQINLDKLDFRCAKSHLNYSSSDKKCHLKSKTVSPEIHDSSHLKSKTPYKDEPSLEPSLELSALSDESAGTKPATKKKAEPDSRHHPFVEKYQALYMAANHCTKSEVPWNAADATRLSRMLRERPNLKLDTMLACLENRFRSEVNLAEEPKFWMLNGKLSSYRATALDAFGKPKGAKPAPSLSSPPPNRRRGRDADEVLRQMGIVK